MAETKEPQIERTFYQERIVICGDCKGSGKIKTEAECWGPEIQCSLCGGEGRILRVESGTVKLFKLN